MKILTALFGLVLSLSAQAGEIFPMQSAFGVPLLSIDGAPAVQGSEFNLFIRPLTEYANSYVVLDAALDGAPIALEHPVRGLWIYNAPQFEMLLTHTLSFTVSLANSTQSDQLSQSICENEKEIQDIETQIANTTDPNQLEQLQALLGQKLTLDQQLMTDLYNLKNAIGMQTYTFSVGAAPVDSVIFPRITAISPNVGALSGGTSITLSGANFVDGASVSVGGVPATNVVVVSPTSITATTAAFSADGAKDVVVTLPLASGDVEQKQGLLSGGFFASSSLNLIKHSPLAGGVHSLHHHGYDHDNMCEGIQ